MHIKENQTLNKLSKWYVGISDSVLLWLKEDGVRNFEKLWTG